MADRDYGNKPPFQAVRARHRHNPNEADTQISVNPTIHLQGRPEDGDRWLADGPPTASYPTPDVAETDAAGQPLRAATEDLWAISSTYGAWRSTNGDSHSDFLLVEPPLNALADTTPNAAARTDVGATPSGPLVSPGTPLNASGSRKNPTVADPLRLLSVQIQTAIEHHLVQQGHPLPLERAPETIDLVRRLTLNYLRHDRTAAELVTDTATGERLLSAVVDETLGFGPLDPLLRDDSISEIMVTGPHMTYVEQSGRLYEVPIHFADDAHLMRIIHKILAPLHVDVTPERPMANCRLADGSYVNVVIPPLSISGPSLTIRRLARRAFTLEQLAHMESLSFNIADFLRRCIRARLNVIICGISGSGKTTLLNALVSSIEDQERLVTVEETAELQLHQRHLVRLEAATPAQSGQGGVTKSDLLAHALRMRPERLIIGDCYGSEALTIIQAMNMGFDGTLTCMYANSPRDALARLEALCLASGAQLSPLAVRQQIATGLDLIIHGARLRDGTRRVVTITDISGMEGDVIGAHDLFVFREAGLDMATGRIRGEFAPTGTRPSFASRIDDNSAYGTSPPYVARGA
jgi:pilus assembly protein CpaF